MWVKEKKITDQGNWKKIAREKNKAQVTGVGAQSPIVEKKKNVNCEETEVTEVRPQKCLCEAKVSLDTLNCDILAVAAMQHRWEQ